MSLPGPSGEATTATRHVPDFKNDGQLFFKHFDKLQDELDDDMVRRLKDGLGGLLISARVVYHEGVTKAIARPRNQQLLHSQAIVRVLHVSDDPTTLYHSAASVCSIEELKSLAFIRGDARSFKRLQALFRHALRVPDRSPPTETIQDEEIQQEDKNLIVFGTSFLHLCFSLGSLGQLLDLSSNASQSQTSRNSEIRVSEDDSSRLKASLTRFWRAQDDRLGRQPPVFTSASLAAGLMLGCLDPRTPIFYEESRWFNYRLGSISSAEPASWNQLALLTLACNTRGGRTMRERIDESFRKIQTAYNTQEPTGELADAVFQAIRSHIRERTRLPCEVFKLAWKLFVCGGEDREAEAYRALGNHVPFLGILEAKVRDEEMPSSYREYFRGLRSECFELILDSVRSISYDDRNGLSATWRFRTQFVFRAVEHYATCIMTLQDAHHIENDEALSFVRRVRACLPSTKPTSGSTRVAGLLEVQPGPESRYKFDANIFERTCERFDQFVRGAQTRRRFAPEDRWCFRQDER
ncbi:hypothetical protein M407DRAFT_21040 [Tulasnella calospora MUT 4182]|uniref:Uncharacterized protein n=1 Tax=Tulasnella calospora MUT 4182 TaxID=1051891 RepID=A0A0C3QNS7_9AGAM|nr:hypothetical protein M407DRAFT_21040 [Tulasnella calospora MUT 4182]